MRTCHPAGRATSDCNTLRSRNHTYADEASSMCMNAGRMEAQNAILLSLLVRLDLCESPGHVTYPTLQ